MSISYQNCPFPLCLLYPAYSRHQECTNTNLSPLEQTPLPSTAVPWLALENSQPHAGRGVSATTKYKFVVPEHVVEFEAEEPVEVGGLEDDRDSDG